MSDRERERERERERGRRILIKYDYIEKVGMLNMQTASKMLPSNQNILLHKFTSHN